MFLKANSKIPLSKLKFYQRFNNSVSDQTGVYGTTSNFFGSGLGLYNGLANHSISIYDKSSFIRINSTADFSFGNGMTDYPFSVSFAFRGDNLGVLTDTFYIKHFISNRNSTDGGNKVWQVMTTNDTTPRIVLVLFDQSTGGDKRYTCNTVLSNSIVYHVVISFHPVNGVSFYLNGILQTHSITTSGTYIAMENLSNNIRIGGANWFDGMTFLGHLDGLGIWNVDLKSEQALAIYNKQASGLEIL